jgi:hypothetical protein
MRAQRLGIVEEFVDNEEGRVHDCLCYAERRAKAMTEQRLVKLSTGVTLNVRLPATARGRR